jgi:exopolysaccharide biosynthesis polyprenyl glycosylphosphotransferase
MQVAEPKGPARHVSTHSETHFAEQAAARLDAALELATPIPRIRARRIGRLLALTDLATLVAVLPLAVFLAALFAGTSTTTPLGNRPGVLLLAPAAIPFLIAYRLYENDRRKITVSALDEMPSLFHALVTFGFLTLVVIIGFGVDTSVLAAREVFAFVATAVLAIPTTRTLVRRHATSPSIARQRTLIVGAGRVGQSVARKIGAHPEFNLEVVGFVDSEPHDLMPDLRHLTVLGSEADLVAVAKRAKVERIIICFSQTPHEDVLEVLRDSGLDGIYLSVVPRFFEIMASNVQVDDVSGIPVLAMQPARLSWLSRTTKRTMDLVLTSIAVPLMLPVLAVIAVAIKLDSEGPVFFRQPRMGRNGKVFRIYKFRTMIPEAEARRSELLHLNEVSGPLFKLKEDPRITRIGSFLRRTSLDELPQLLNVLRGEMSLVGPRPFVTYEADGIDGWARRRLDLTPGITGAWQVMGRNDMPFEEMVKLDYLYVTNWSLAWDIRLLLRTIPSVLRRKGAY